MKRPLLCIAFGLLLGGQAFAPIRAVNQRLDVALHPSRATKGVVVAGRIAAIEPKKPADPARIWYWQKKSLQFQVSGVIHGDTALKGKSIELPLAAFAWPEEVVPQQKDVFCILVLRTESADRKTPYSITSVIPAHGRVFGPADSAEKAKRVLARELLAEIKDEKSPNRRRHLILQVSPILTREEAPALVPLLEGENIWLKRAALGALTHATGDEKYIRMVLEDVREFLKTTTRDDLVKGLEHGREYAPYPLLFRHYFFLRVGVTPEGNREASAYSPVFRLIADELEDHEWKRWSYGIYPLCFIGTGTKDDLKRLYDYYRSERVGQRKDILDRPYNRQLLLLGMSRILNLGLSNWSGPDFLKKEAGQHRKVRAALLKLGIIQNPDND